MKSVKFFAISFAAIFAFILMQSCNSDNSVSNTDGTSSDEFAVFNYSVSEFTMQDATVDNDINLPECEPMRPEMDNRDGFRPPHAKDRIMLGKVIRAMELTDEQKAEIRSLMAAHVECEKTWFKKLNDARKAVIDSSNALRRVIHEKVKAGEITRRDAEKLIRDLNKNVRDEIKNLPVNEEVRAGIIACRTEFFDSIANLLTEEQLVKWNRFLETIKK